MNWQKLKYEICVDTSTDNKGSIKFYNADNSTMFYIFKNGMFSLCDLNNVSYYDQKKILKFLKQTPEEWFKGEEYNIVIGSNLDGYTFTAYAHYERNGAKAYYVNNGVTEYDLKSEKYKFTQDEIDDLKSKLPENMAKIVDLGKTEVKDNDD